MGFVGPFDGRLGRVTLTDTLKVTKGKKPHDEKKIFRRDAQDYIDKVAGMLPVGPSFFHGAFRLQVLEHLFYLAQPESNDLPPWTGRIVYQYNPTESELEMRGHIECAFPEEKARQKLADYCHALAAMLLAYAQLAGTPAFSLAFEFTGKWVAERGQ